MKIRRRDMIFMMSLKLIRFRYLKGFRRVEASIFYDTMQVLAHLVICDRIVDKIQRSREISYVEKIINF